MIKYSFVILILSVSTMFGNDSNFIRNNEINSIIKKYNMKGSVLIFDANHKYFIGNDIKRSKRGFIPASTFKIVNSLIGFETGILQDTNHFFKWNGEKRRLTIWDKDMNLKEAYRISCVPCYQELAVKIGVENMNKYLNLFNYGKMIVNADYIDKFWLEGESKITQFQQIEFLKKLYYEELPISKNSMKQTKELMFIEKNDKYELYGKTGWAIRNGNNYGWYVGYIVTANNTYFFATNIEPKNNKDTNNFAAARKNITTEAMKFLKFID